MARPGFPPTATPRSPSRFRRPISRCPREVDDLPRRSPTPTTRRSPPAATTTVHPAVGVCRDFAHRPAGPRRRGTAAQDRRHRYRGESLQAAAQAHRHPHPRGELRRENPHRIRRHHHPQRRHRGNRFHRRTHPRSRGLARRAARRHAITPRSNGLHFLTLRGTDPEGRPIATITRFQVYGTDEYPVAIRGRPARETRLRKEILSARRNRARARALADRGHRARHRGAREGPALVPGPAQGGQSGHRDSAHRRRRAERLCFRAHRQGRAGTPRASSRRRSSASVIASCSSRTAATASTSRSTRRRKPTAPATRPTSTGTVTLADGKPAAGAEVTLYAEDEGTLAVMGYDTPKPMEFFYQPRLLGVEAGTSFQSFIAEDPGNADLQQQGLLRRRRRRPGQARRPAAQELRSLRDLGARPRHRCRREIQPSFQAPGHADPLPRHRHRPSRDHPFRPRRVRHRREKGPDAGTQGAAFRQPDGHHQPAGPRAERLAFSGTWQVRSTPTPPPARRFAAPSATPWKPSASLPEPPPPLVFPTLAENTGEAVLTWKAVPVSLKNGALTDNLTRQLSDAVEAASRSSIRCRCSAR